MIPRGATDSRMNLGKNLRSDPRSDFIECCENGTEPVDVDGPSAAASRPLLMGNVAYCQSIHFEHPEVSAEATPWLPEFSRHHFGAGCRVVRDERQELDPHGVRKDCCERFQMMVAVLLVLWHDRMEPLQSRAGSELMVHLK